MVQGMGQGQGIAKTNQTPGAGQQTIVEGNCCVGTQDQTLEQLLKPNYNYTAKHGYMPSKPEERRIISTRGAMLNALCPDPELGQAPKAQLTDMQLAAFDPKRFVGFKPDGTIIIKGFGGKEYPIDGPNEPINAETVALARRLGFDVNSKTPYKHIIFMAYNNSVTGGTEGAKLLAMASAMNKPLEFAFATSMLDPEAKKYVGLMPKMVNGKLEFHKLQITEKPTTCQCPLRLGYGEDTGGANWCKQGAIPNPKIPPETPRFDTPPPAAFGPEYRFGKGTVAVHAKYFPGISRDMCVKETGLVNIEMNPEKPKQGGYQLFPLIFFGGSGNNFIAQCVRCIAPGGTRRNTPTGG